MSDQGQSKQIRGYGRGGVETVISVEDVNRQASQLAKEGIPPSRLAELAQNDDFVKIDGLRAGYGKMQILHDFNLQVGKGQSLCLIGPNGAGKSTVLHSIFGFTNIFGGAINVNGKNVTKLSPKDKLRSAGVAYILQDKSVFPGMTVEENLWMGGYLMDKPTQAKERPRRSSRSTRAWPSAASTRPRCCPAASAGCWRFPALW